MNEDKTKILAINSEYFGKVPYFKVGWKVGNMGKYETTKSLQIYHITAPNKEISDFYSIFVNLCHANN